MTAWRTACPDWADRLLAGRTLVPDLPLFAAEAEKALKVFKRLRIPDVVGRPTNAEASGEWVFPIVEAIFGAYDADLGRQMIQEYDLVIPKKNAKTSTSASIAVTALIVNKRPLAEIVVLAPQKSVADLLFDQAVGIIRADEALSRLFYPQQHYRTITHRRTGAKIKVLAADTSAVTGGKQKITIIDELHELASNSKAPAILTEVFGALNARPDGFVLVITTQSKDPPRGVFKQMIERARDVRDGKVDLPILPIIYELPEALGPDAWKDEKNWGLVNPNLGRSVDVNFLRTALLKAEGAGQAARHELALLASQHFNVEIGSAQRADRWIGAEFWESATDPTLTLETLIERCDVACIGIDGGGLDDLFGLVVLGRDRVTDEWLAWGRAYAHRIVLAKRKSEATLLEDFAAEGDLVLDGDPESYAAPRRKPGSSEPAPVPFDIAGIIAVVELVNEAGILHAVGLDPAGVGGVVDALSAVGVGSEDDQAAHGRSRVVGVPQGFALMRGIKTVERKLRDGTFWHAAQALMAWSASNARTEYRANYVMVTKAVSGVGKIDPLMALFDAAFLMAGNPESERHVSIYDRPELWDATPNLG